MEQAPKPDDVIGMLPRILLIESDKTESDKTARAISDSLHTYGAAILTLTGKDFAKFQKLDAAAEHFFDQRHRIKERAAHPLRRRGRRGFGYGTWTSSPAVSALAARNLNDSFVVENGEEIPGQNAHESIERLAKRIPAGRAIAQKAIELTFRGAQLQFGINDEEMPNTNSSIYQINSMVKKPSHAELRAAGIRRKELAGQTIRQGLHEDLTFATVAMATGSGLWVMMNGRLVRATLEEDELIVMPGSPMEVASGGYYQALYHRVTFDGHRKRRSYQEFAASSLDHRYPLRAWVYREGYEDISIPKLLKSVTDTFGSSVDLIRERSQLDETST